MDESDETDEAIRIDQKVIYLLTGQTYQLNAIVSKEYKDAAVTWYTYDESSVSVDQNGLVTAKADGTGKIYAEISSAGQRAECDFVVRDYEINSVTFNKPEYYFKPGVTTSIWNYIYSDQTSSAGFFVIISVSDEDVMYADEYMNLHTVNKGDVTVTVSNEKGTSTDSALFHVGGYADYIYLPTEYTSSTFCLHLNEEMDLPYGLDNGKFNIADFPDEKITWTLNNGSSCITLDEETGRVHADNYGHAQVIAKISNGSDILYDIYVGDEPETIGFNNDTIYLDHYQGHSLNNYLKVTPANAINRITDIKVSDTSVAYISGDYLYGAEKGETDLIVSHGDLSATAHLIVGEYAGDIYMSKIVRLKQCGSVRRMFLNILCHRKALNFQMKK